MRRTRYGRSGKEKLARFRDANISFSRSPCLRGLAWLYEKVQVFRDQDVRTD
jgi:hypothetical protein